MFRSCILLMLVSYLSAACGQAEVLEHHGPKKPTPPPALAHLP